ncbi:hypothetical protein [Haloarcula nitratireducens]|uniref:Uncharacterized protein n=1 Tax=Haloarcula nitratireducens TaxID=2487749 RepID=A0AAW4P843_9EURY|nr:hypothetical protein [Halomicroarcula nitratireducens]MBX0293705.1 hypothetical protein [Halomicroarcula nitratireducens]
MKHLAPSNVPVYETADEQRAIWRRCAERGQPVIAVRNATRGYIVKYDLQHLDRQLSPSVVQQLRDRVRSRRPYPTGTDPISETEGVGGEAGPVSGELHAPTEAAARELASHISQFVLDRDNWR